MIPFSIMRVPIGLLAILAAACSNAGNTALPATHLGDHLRLSGDSAVLKTKSNGQHAFVTGYFGDDGPHDIIVDTGSGTNVIDQTLARSLGYEKTGEREVLSGGIDPMTFDVVTVPLLRVDGLEIVDTEFLAIDLEGMSMGQIDGILGMPTFEDALITFDLKNEAIIVAEGALSRDDTSVLEYKAPEQSPFPVKSIIANVAGRDVSMHIDTGATSGFMFPMALSETLPLKGPLIDGPRARLVGAERTTKNGDLDGVIKLGDLEFDNPSIGFIDPSSPHGNLGLGVLSDLVMTIDQQNDLVSMRRAGNTAVAKRSDGESAGSPRRLGVQLRGRGGSALSISWVEPNSLGARAGFKEGDVLVSVNGKPAEDYDMSELGALFRSTAPLQFEVDRAGEKRIIEIR